MKTEFHVEGMSCQHCVAAVTNAVREHDEAANVQVDLEAGRVAVESTQAVDVLKAAIEDAGYTVKDVQRRASADAGAASGGSSGSVAR
ncbi:heavy-metal-associated domain-containing protein [Paraburkholderia phenoliruptrix]|uniref:heavy-metal-associated domain-containing protein n=1 Tax=Paraburkholderia phenoliruptrix TaxID=252970 RepID=UPI001C6E34B8|nr:cation transporter [Paraburkholderia phenoliruptrix]MBW9107617.1 heavy-metal-associated domain-containing protein [Paraburkholderia phenoliruptrix]MBW9133392.1 heavy-metal-associated domain-containing protein [Paraburkholderia ginsengiterrae]